MKFVIFTSKTQALDDDGDSGGGGGGSEDGWGEEMISGAVFSLPKATNEDVATPPWDSWRVISGRLWNSGTSLGGPVLGVRGVRKPAKLLLLDIPRHIMSMGGHTGIAHNPNITSRSYVFHSSCRACPSC